MWSEFITVRIIIPHSFGICLARFGIYPGCMPVFGRFGAGSWIENDNYYY
jgi:hypothetical protein